MSPIEAAMVDELNSELRDICADYRFIEALRGAVRHTSKITGTYITSKFATSAMRSSADQLADATAAGSSAQGSQQTTQGESSSPPQAAPQVSRQVAH